MKSPWSAGPSTLAEACQEELEIQRAALPGAWIELVTQGDVRGEFDGSRLREALGNLVTKHWIAKEPVIIKVEGNDLAVKLSVENAADRDISANEMEQLFEPLRRGAGKGPGSDRSNLGLGLFIVRQIAKVHGGNVQQNE